MTLRRLFVLLSQLPPDSRTKAKLAGDNDGRRWTEETAMLADVQELLQLIRIEQLVSIPFKEKIDLPELQRLTRPDYTAPGDEDQDEDDEPRESAAERYERIQRYLAQFDPPPAEPQPGR